MAVTAGPGTPARAAASKEAALGYLLLAARRSRVFAVFVFYPFVRNFKLALYETPPFPGLPARYVGLHQVWPSSPRRNSSRAW